LLNFSTVANELCLDIQNNFSFQKEPANKKPSFSLEIEEIENVVRNYPRPLVKSFKE